MTEPEPNRYERLLDATIAIARGAPAKQGTNVYSAQVPWSRIHELRDALDGAGIVWRRGE